MNTRRNFLAGLGAVSCLACGVRRASAQAPARRQISVGGTRVRAIDIHCHCVVPEVADIVKGTPMEPRHAATVRSTANNPTIAARIAAMDQMGIDVEAMSINPWWYNASRDMARRLCDAQNEKLMGMCKQAPDRLTAFAAVSLQFPELAAEQLETGMKQMGLKGAAVGGSVEGQELSHPKFEPFWKKAEELQAFIFMHPQESAEATGVAARVKGYGSLANVIGNPLETTICLSHLIFDGTLDKFPNLKIAFAHAGGYLPSYSQRMDYGCREINGCKDPKPKKKPSEYLKQIFVDSMVFSGNGLRHLVAECGSSQIMVGTDYNFGWVTDPIGHILDTQGLSDADKIAMLGGNAAKLMKL